MAKAYRKGEILLALFKLLEGAPDGMKPKEIIAKLTSKLELTEHEKGEYESGGRRFDKIVRFASIDAVKVGWLIKNNGEWMITPAGLEAMKKFPTPELMQKNEIKLYNEWRKTHNPEGGTEEKIEDGEEASDGNSVTFEEAEEQAQESIDLFLHKMDPFEFQKLVAELLNAMGYHVIWISTPGKDGGIDILAYTDPLGIQGPRIKVQVKQQQNAVSEPELKSFMSNIAQNDSGIYFCTGGFSSSAHNYARNQESKRIILVDSKMLVRLWIANMKKLSDQAWQRLPMTPIYFLTPGS